MTVAGWAAHATPSLQPFVELCYQGGGSTKKALHSPIGGCRDRRINLSRLRRRLYRADVGAVHP
jgi:hypothetical protein